MTIKVPENFKADKTADEFGIPLNSEDGNDFLVKNGCVIWFLDMGSHAIPGWYWIKPFAKHGHQKTNGPFETSKEALDDYNANPDNTDSYLERAKEHDELLQKIERNTIF